MQLLGKTNDQRRVKIKAPMRRISLLLFHTNTHCVARKTHLSHRASLDSEHLTGSVRASMT